MIVERYVIQASFLQRKHNYKFLIYIVSRLIVPIECSGSFQMPHKNFVQETMMEHAIFGWRKKQTVFQIILFLIFFANVCELLICFQNIASRAFKTSF